MVHHGIAAGREMPKPARPGWHWPVDVITILIGMSLCMASFLMTKGDLDLDKMLCLRLFWTAA